MERRTIVLPPVGEDLDEQVIKDANDAVFNGELNVIIDMAHGVLCGCHACKSRATEAAEYLGMTLPQDKWEAAQTIFISEKLRR